ncbi:hypothetical protein V2J09_017316 [Rumex salicifolius]
MFNFPILSSTVTLNVENLLLAREIAIGPVDVVSLLLSSLGQRVVDPSVDPVAYRQLQLKGLFGLSHFTTKTDAVSVLKTVFITVHQEWYPLNFLLGCSLLVFILGARFMVMISFAKIIVNAVLPSAEILGRLNGTETFCEVNRYPLSIIKPPGLLIIRINSALLCFANANFIKERVTRYVIDEVEVAVGNAKAINRTIILDLSNVMHVDTSGIIALEELYKKLLAVANPQWQVIHKLKLVQFVDKVGERWFFLTVNEAVETCFGSACG